MPAGEQFEPSSPQASKLLAKRRSPRTSRSPSDRHRDAIDDVAPSRSANDGLMQDELDSFSHRAVAQGAQDEPSSPQAGLLRRAKVYAEADRKGGRGTVDGQHQWRETSGSHARSWGSPGGQGLLQDELDRLSQPSPPDGSREGRLSEPSSPQSTQLLRQKRATSPSAPAISDGTLQLAEEDDFDAAWRARRAGADSEGTHRNAECRGGPWPSGAPTMPGVLHSSAGETGPPPAAAGHRSKNSPGSSTRRLQGGSELGQPAVSQSRPARSPHREPASPQGLTQAQLDALTCTQQRSSPSNSRAQDVRALAEAEPDPPRRTSPGSGQPRSDDGRGLSQAQLDQLSTVSGLGPDSGGSRNEPASPQAASMLRARRHHSPVGGSWAPSG